MGHTAGCNAQLDAGIYKATAHTPACLVALPVSVCRDLTAFHSTLQVCREVDMGTIGVSVRVNQCPSGSTLACSSQPASMADTSSTTPVGAIVGGVIGGGKLENVWRLASSCNPRW